MRAGGSIQGRGPIVLLGLLVLSSAISIHRYRQELPADPYQTVGGRTMGTSWELKIAGDRVSPDALRAAGEASQAVLDRVDALMSTWDPGSELSRFNTHRSTEPFPVSSETFTVLLESTRIFRISGGAFDASIRPLVYAWGFASHDPRPPPPTSAALAAIREHVGWRGVELDRAAQTVAKRHPALEIDLSAIAKGYAVDQVAEALLSLGHDDFLIEVGGELRASGRKRGGEAWRVAIARPSSGVDAVHRSLDLCDRSMATSGDYRNYRKLNGQDLSHTIDPRNGRPVSHGLASVTVVHASAMTADAWATALSVLGAEDGYAIAARHGLAAYFIERTAPGRFVGRATPQFALLIDEGEPEG